MENVEYRIDLPQSSATVLCISHKTLGVGSAGCGPRPLPQYQVMAEPTSFSYTLQIK
jgi:beta-galactosidase